MIQNFHLKVLGPKTTNSAHYRERGVAKWTTLHACLRVSIRNYNCASRWSIPGWL